MEFARKVWKLLVAIKDGLSLLFLLAFFALLYAALSSRPHPGEIRSGALLLNLDGMIVEEPAVLDPVTQLLSAGAPTREYRARDVVRALRLAARDDRIKAVVLDLSTFLGGGLVHMQDIGDALDEVRAAKKPVLTYATAYVDDSLLLAAHASEVWVDPMGGAFILGPGGNRLYFARLLDKLNITANVFRVGTFKSAVEPYILDGPSDASRAAYESLYGAIWEEWKGNVAKARPKAQIEKVSGDPAGWLRESGGDVSKAAQAAGLIDRIGSRTEFGARVAEMVGKDPADKTIGMFAHTKMDALLAGHPIDKRGKAIGVITIAGDIVDGDAGPGAAGGDRITRLLDEALDEDLAALVIRVDSPGGSVFASEQIRRAILRIQERKIPVVASMSNFAASGGYWVVTPARRIFAEPATVTGSIGVFAILPTFDKALADLGVTGAGVKTTPLSGQPDLLTGLAPEVSEMIQASVEHSYDQFLMLVGKSRGKNREQADAVAQGRPWDGGTARQLGLVDQFGGLEDALAYAAGEAGLKDGGWHAEYLGESEGGLAAFLRQMRDRTGTDALVARDLAGIAAQRQAAIIDEAVAQARRLLSAQGVQAYCLECVPLAGRAMPRERGTELSGLTALLRLKAE